jgi:peroxiredoxin Q/BCP
MTPVQTQFVMRLTARESVMRMMLFAAGLLCLAIAAPPIAMAQAKPQVGAEAPAFRLADQNGAWHSLSDYRGRWLVLYFYPKDNTPHCTTEACEFRDNIFAFRQLDAEIVGISLDDAASHKQFAQDNRLPFTLLADTGKTVAKSYGVLRNVLAIMEVANRETFVIDPQGRIAKHYPRVEAKGHSAEVLADLKALQAKAAPVKPQP